MLNNMDIGHVNVKNADNFNHTKDNAKEYSWYFVDIATGNNSSQLICWNWSAFYYIHKTIDGTVFLI